MEQLVRLVHRHMQFDAQLMEHGFMPLENFKSIFESCDLLVAPKIELNLNIGSGVDELVDLLKTSWRGSGQRFLGGNFARLSDKELKQVYPDLFPAAEPFYLDFIRQH